MSRGVQERPLRDVNTSSHLYAQQICWAPLIRPHTRTTMRVHPRAATLTYMVSKFGILNQFPKPTIYEHRIPFDKKPTLRTLLISSAPRLFEDIPYCLSQFKT
jgi:hypothetical protein